MRNIYFAGAIRGGKEKKEDYKYIIKELLKYGNVVTEHIGGKRAKKVDNARINKLKGDKFIFERDMYWLKDADLVVADITVNSFGVGFEVGEANQLKKETILIWDKKFISENNIKISALAKGNSRITCLPYKSLPDLFSKLAKLLH